MYEGTPDHPGRDRWWALVEKYGVTILYTAPTAIRTFMKWGTKEPEAHDLSSLRLLGSVGEPINPEAWIWYHTVIGGGRCPVVDTWWQTETGAIMITPLPGATTLKPGSATFPLPGIGVEVVDEKGKKVESALVDHPKVAESAVVGAKDDTTGQAIIAFVTLKGEVPADDALGNELRAHVSTRIGAISRPKTVIFTDDLPKTRSGKIMRRLLKDVAEGRDLGDTTTLADPAVVEEIRTRAAAAPPEE
jgi:acyl-coenzyme A synthetase/AMP-(fatty) acid ligase